MKESGQDVSPVLQDIRFYSELNGYGNKPSLCRTALIVLENRGLWILLLHRFGFWVNSIRTSYKNPLKFLLKFLYFMGKALGIWICKTDILVSTRVEGGVFVSNKGNIIIGAHCIGKGSRISHDVTIGQGVDGRIPVIGRNVFVGTGSIVFGGIQVGDGVWIGEDTVLSKSLPANIQVAGNPCRVISKS